MFKSMKSKVTVLLIGGIVSGATLASPAFAKHHTQEAVSTESSQKLALAHEEVATEQATVVSGDSAKSKARKSVKPSQSNYFDVEKYNFDMGGTSACVGI